MSADRLNRLYLHRMSMESLLRLRARIDVVLKEREVS